MGSRDALERAGFRVLDHTKAELSLALPFLSSALDRLRPRLDMRTRRIGTDGKELYFFTGYLTELFLHSPRRLDRTYLHILMHCLFRHLSGGYLREDRELWDLASDIAAEAAADTLTIPELLEVPSDLRQACYAELTADGKVLTAERIYARWKEDPPDEERLAALREEFCRCDHAYWPKAEAAPRENDPERPPSSVEAMLLRTKEMEEAWKKEAERLRSELITLGPEAAHGEKSFLFRITMDTGRRPDYKDFLRRFAVPRETIGADPDRFDYAYYTYGLEHYGNIPLIEEYELREQKKVDEFLIAVDTSASCRRELVRRFLSETAAILCRQESFFHTAKILLVECDERVRSVKRFEGPGDLKDWSGTYEVHGGGGTDFRPVFRFVEEEQREGRLNDLRGIIYFTDGFGTWPEHPAPVSTAFVFMADREYRDTEVPPWAMRVYLSEENDSVTVLPPSRAGAEGGK